ncbi:MAG: aspartate-semialdehyde dehydrogenase [Bacteroidales bacterium]
MKVAVVGATGLVGQTMLRVLEERKFPVTRLYPVASSRSVGKSITFNGRDHGVISIMEAVEARPDIALFSAGGATSVEWAPAFAEVGTVVIDNSSAWRMEPGIPLVIPEINSHVLKKEDRIIANPNCSTIQMLMAIAPLHRRYGIKRIVVSTYQSVTGTGVKASTQLFNESKGITGEMAYPHQIYNNCIPQCDMFLENGYTKEEMKLVNETRKILESQEIQVCPTAVRVPVTGGHSESVNIEFENEFEISDVVSLISAFPGVVISDKPFEGIYPMPVLARAGMRFLSAG